MPVVSDIVNAVITELSQVPGVATQLYSSGKIQQHVTDAYLLELEEMWWPNIMTYVGPIAVDQGTGLLQGDLTGPLAPISAWRDVARVWPANSNKPMRELPQSTNPLLVQQRGGVGYIAPDYTFPNRPFRIYPSTAAPEVVVWGRQRQPTPLKSTDTVSLDPLLLQYDASWMYAVDDGTIPAQVNKYQVLAQNRRRMLKASYAQHPIELDPRFPAGGFLEYEWDGGYFVLDEDPLA